MFHYLCKICHDFVTRYRGRNFFEKGGGGWRKIYIYKKCLLLLISLNGILINYFLISNGNFRSFSLNILGQSLNVLSFFVWLLFGVQLENIGLTWRLLHTCIIRATICETRLSAFLYCDTSAVTCDMGPWTFQQYLISKNSPIYI